MSQITFPIIPEQKRRAMLMPPTGRIRLIIDTDAHNEIDDQFAIAWALLSQDRLDVEGVVAEPYSFAHERPAVIKLYDILQADPSATIPEELQGYEGWVRDLLRIGTNAHDIPFVLPAEGAELSYQEILRVFDKLEEDPTGRVFRGSPGYLASPETPLNSPAAEFIIERAMATRDRPLYIAAIGCLTNIASAILLEPRIIERIVVLWTSSYPSCVNLPHHLALNLVQDVAASQLLFDCGVPLVYLPGFYIGAQLMVSLPEVEAWVRGKGQIGDYLHHLYTHNPIHVQRGIDDHFGRTWVIWDIINIAWLLYPEWVPSQLMPTPMLTENLYWQHDPSRPLMREAIGINRDAIFRDFYTKLTHAP